MTPLLVPAPIRRFSRSPLLVLVLVLVLESAITMARLPPSPFSVAVVAILP